MANLIIGNSYSKITGLTAVEEKKLRNALSYTTDPAAAYFSGGFVKRKYLINRRGEFPTGLLSKVTDIIKPTALMDARTKPAQIVPITYKGPKPLEWQTKASSSLLFSDRGILTAPTGTGKSILIALIASRLQLRTLVVVPTLEIKKQLTETLRLALNGYQHVTVENIDSSALKRLTDFDCLIIDEAHHVAAKTYQNLNKTAWTNIYYRYFLTATPFRNQDNEMLLFEAIAGKVIYKLDYKEAISKGYIVPIEAYYLEIPKQKTDAHTYQQVYKELVVNNDIRNEKIRVLLDLLCSYHRSALCLIKEIEHGKQLTPFPFVSGEDQLSRQLINQFNSRAINVLVSTTGIMGEGVDSRPCEFVVIAGGGKAKSPFMQAVGRAVRKYPGKVTAKVILIKDRSHKYLIRHFNEQKKILLDEYGVKVIKLKI